MYELVNGRETKRHYREFTADIFALSAEQFPYSTRTVRRGEQPIVRASYLLDIGQRVRLADITCEETRKSTAFRRIVTQREKARYSKVDYGPGPLVLGIDPDDPSQSYLALNPHDAFQIEQPSRSWFVGDAGPFDRLIHLNYADVRRVK
jgi:hypothetical protein